MNHLSKKFDDIYKHSTLIFSKKEIEESLDRIAQEMSDKLKNSNPVFLCVLLGGIVPLGNLLLRLDFQLELNYIHVSSYGQKTVAGDLHWKAEPTIDLFGRTVVVVDDILDTGTTLRAAIEYCKLKGAKEVFTAVLLDKHKSRKPGGIEKADFTALTVDDKYVFGYGLDYAEYLRNAPGIYAVSPEHQ